MTGAIFVLNSGSSSLKFGLFEAAAAPNDVRSLARGSADGVASDRGKISVQSADGESLYDQAHAIDNQPHALQLVCDQLRAHGLPAPEVIGHRVVHGGPSLVEHQKITPQVLERLEAAAHFAPLHVPVALALIRESQHLFAGVPQFACFDTAFHRTLPEAAARFALPEKFWDAGVRRYGFHGLSCESILHALGESIPPRLVIAHLGNGASITAVSRGASIDTTMGLTPTGGIIMGTRPGDLDPGVVVHILHRARDTGARTDNLKSLPGASKAVVASGQASTKFTSTGKNQKSADPGSDESGRLSELGTLLDKESGLLGISGLASDMRRLRDAAPHNPRARLATEMFARTAKKAIAGYVAILGGLDLLVFTGGIGEHDSAARAEICDGLQSFGVHLDPEANRRSSPEIAASQSAVRIRILPSDEESQIARHVSRLLVS
jgi:acetate kinase